MKIAKIVLTITLLGTLALLTGCSGNSGSGTPGDAKAGLKIVFSNTSTGTMQKLGITSMTLDVIPASTSSSAPASVNLFAYHQQNHTFSYPLTNLTDNEYYVFRIKAYNSLGTMVYSGQTGQKLLPGDNSITLTAYDFTNVAGSAGKGFAGAVGYYDGTAFDGSTFTLSVNSLGVGTGTSSGGSITAYMTPSATGNFDVIVFTRGTAGTTCSSGTVNASTGSGSGSGVNSVGSPIGWTISRHVTNYSSVVGTYDGTALDSNSIPVATLSLTVDSNGNVSGTSSNGYVISGKLTSSDIAGSYFMYSGTSTSGNDVVTWQGSMSGASGMISGSYSGATSGNGTWSASKRSSVTAQSVLQSGIFLPKINSYGGTTGSTMAYAIERVGLATDGVSLTGAYTYYDPAPATWTTTRPTGYPATLFAYGTDYYLTASGWVSGGDGPQNSTFASNSDGSATLTNKTNSSAFKLTVTAIAISGQTIAAQGAGTAWWPILSTAGVFPTGSIRYDMTWTNLSDSYTLWGSNLIPLPTGTTLDQVPSYMQQVYVDSNNHSINYSAKFLSTGSTVEFYQQTMVSGQTTQPTPVLIGSGSYAIVTVSGQQILEITIPSALRTQYKLGGNPIFSIVGGAIYGGSHEVPGVSYSNDDKGANSIAVQHLQNSLSP